MSDQQDQPYDWQELAVRAVWALSRLCEVEASSALARIGEVQREVHEEGCDVNVQYMVIELNVASEWFGHVLTALYEGNLCTAHEAYGALHKLYHEVTEEKIDVRQEMEVEIQN